MAVHGGKSKIRHKNMADGVAENDGCHGGQKKGGCFQTIYRGGRLLFALH